MNNVQTVHQQAHPTKRREIPVAVHRRLQKACTVQPHRMLALFLTTKSSTSNQNRNAMYESRLGLRLVRGTKYRVF